MTIRLAVVSVLQLGNLAILARFLDQDAFGLASLVFVTLMLCELFSQCGIDMVVVRTQGDVEPLLDAAWSLRVVRGVGLGLLMLILAYPIAVFQDAHQLVPLFCLAALVPIIDGTQSMGPLLLGRALAQGRVAILDIIAVSIAVVTGALLAWWLRSAWALVLNTIIYSVLRSIASYVCHAHRPRFTGNWKPLRAHLQYGIYFSLSAGMYYLVTCADKFWIGRQLGLTTLGGYERSSTLATFGASQLPRLFSSTAYPGLANTLTEPARFRRNAVRFLGSVAVVCALASVSIVLLAYPLVTLILGAKYVALVPIFRLLGFLTLTRGLIHAADTILDLKAKSNWRFQSYFGQLTTLCLALPWGTHHFGLFGAASAVVITSIVGATISLTFCALVLRTASPQVAAAPSGARLG